MKRFFSIILLICSAAAVAAPPSAPETIAAGRAPYGGEVRVCASTDESAVSGFPQSKYIKPLGEWRRSGNGLYASSFGMPFAWVNRQVVLHVEWATLGYKVEVNGREVGFTRSGMIPTDFVITKYVVDGRNEVVITPFLDAREGVLSSKDIFEIGRTYVQSAPPMRVRDIVSRTTMGTDGKALVEMGIVMKSEMLNPKSVRVYYELLTDDSVRLTIGHKELSLDMQREDTVRFAVRIPDSCLWTQRRPHMLRLDVRTQNNGKYLETETFRIGLREVKTDRRGLTSVNGKPAALIVARVSGKVTAADIDALLKQGYNTVQPAAGVVDRSLYALCDSMGMYAIAQVPVATKRWGDSRRKGGNPSNDNAWTESYVDRAEGVYHTLKGHPSVVAFSIAEESANGICLYESYLRLKSFGDPRRVIYDDGGGEWNTDLLRRFNSPAEAGL